MEASLKKKKFHPQTATSVHAQESSQPFLTASGSQTYTASLHRHISPLLALNLLLHLSYWFCFSGSTRTDTTHGDHPVKAGHLVPIRSLHVNFPHRTDHHVIFFLAFPSIYSRVALANSTSCEDGHILERCLFPIG